MTDIQDGQPSLTTEIADFTAGAVKRLPPHYLGAFEALVTRLARDGIGRNAPAIGAAFPDFALRDDAGRMVRASERWIDRTLVVKFYRGGWCPYCNLELAALQRQSDAFAQLNAEVLAIAPERATAMAGTKQKAAAGFAFLWDEDSKLARLLGISFPVDAAVKAIYGELGIDLAQINGEWELPVPATFIVRSGVVRFRHIDPNYLLRQDPLDLLAVLRTEAGAAA